MSNSQLSKLKFRIKIGTEVTLNLSLTLIGKSNDETNFSHKLLLTDKQISKIRKAFANGSSVNIKFSKTHFFKMIQSRRLIYPKYIEFPAFRIIYSVVNPFEN